MRNKFLLGVNNYDELVFGEFEVRNINGYDKFSASFDAVRPFKGGDYNLVEYYEDLMDSIDKLTIYEWLVQYDCKPSELAEELASECYDVRDALDCSLYPEEIIVNGESWYFESSGCGQHDTRKEGMKKYVNLEAYNLLHELWDNYHLKQVDDDVIKQVEKLINMLSNIDEEEWIINHIKEEYYD